MKTPAGEYMFLICAEKNLLSLFSYTSFVSWVKVTRSRLLLTATAGYTYRCRVQGVSDGDGGGVCTINKRQTWTYMHQKLLIYSSEEMVEKF